jgi:hypothetical protein
MLSREIIAVYTNNHTKHINTLRGQKAGFQNVEAGGTYSLQDFKDKGGRLCDTEHPAPCEINLHNREY